MKKFIILAIIAASSLSATAQSKNDFKVTPKVLITGDTLTSVNVVPTVSILDSITYVSVTLKVTTSVSGRKQEYSLPAKRFKYPRGTFTKYPATKAEIMAKVEQELSIDILN